MRFIFKYPSRGRPDWFQETLANYYRKLSGHHQYRFVITMDEDDTSMNTAPMRQWLNAQRDLTYHYGSNENKIQACNVDVPRDDWDILVLISDDMTPLETGFDDIIARDMSEHFPALDGVLHYDDGKVGDVLMTLQVLGRAFYEKVGFVYWPGYRGTWCDNDTMLTAKRMNKYWYSPHTIVRHDWRGNEKYKGDLVYQRGEASYHQDHDLFDWRATLNFPVSYSQQEEDYIIRDYFRDQYKGRFLDIGAADGVTFSNTRLLYEMGWKGVAVEMAEHFVKHFWSRQLEARHDSKNNLSITNRNIQLFDPTRLKLIHAALVEKEGPIEYWHTEDFTSTLNAEHRNRWESITPFQKKGCDAITWKSLTDQFGIDYDFLSLDIEGESAKLFHLMPYTLLERVRLMCIEHDGLQEKIIARSAPYGFRLLYQNAENVILGK